MISFRRILIFVLAVSGCLAIDSTVRAEDMPYGQGLLWRVEKAGVTSHVFGTVHSVDERMVILPATVAEVFEDASSLTLELITDASTELKSALLMQMPEGRTLQDVIGPEMFAAVVETGSRYGVPSPMLQSFKPWAVLAVFSVSPSEFARIAKGERILDDRLQQEATDRSTPVYGLETVEEQLAIFDEMPEADQVALLAGLLAENSTIEEQFAELLQSYVACDVAAIYRMMTESIQPGEEELYARFERRLIIDRNHRMAERLAERLGEGGAFIAVGALHLPGEEGLLNLLTQQGFEVSRVY